MRKDAVWPSWDCAACGMARSHRTVLMRVLCEHCEQPHSLGEARHSPIAPGGDLDRRRGSSPPRHYVSDW
jgi:hypothetical protein